MRKTPRGGKMMAKMMSTQVAVPWLGIFCHFLGNFLEKENQIEEQEILLKIVTNPKRDNCLDFFASETRKTRVWSYIEMAWGHVSVSYWLLVLESYTRFLRPVKYSNLNFWVSMGIIQLGLINVPRYPHIHNNIHVLPSFSLTFDWTTYSITMPYRIHS